MGIQTEIARAVNQAGWTCEGGSDEPGQYDECEDCKRVCDTFADVLMPLVKRARAEALREAQSLIAADGFFCPSLDDRIEQGETDD